MAESKMPPTTPAICPLIVVTNCLNCSPKPLCYTNVRTVFSVAERQQQLFESFESVGKYAPRGSRIFYVEVSALTPDQYSAYVTFSHQFRQQFPHCDITYFDLSSDPDVAYARDSPFKGYGDLIPLIKMIPYIRSLQTDPAITHIWKLNGRYALTERFSAERFAVRDRYSFRVMPSTDRSVYTFFWGFPINFLADLECRWNQSIHKQLVHGRGLELVMYANIPTSARHHVEPLGVTGKCAVDGATVDV